MMDALIDLTVKSTALIVGGALIVLIMRRASAASRHQIWAGVFCAVALMPIARLGLPALNVAVLEPRPLHLRVRPIVIPAEAGTSAVFVGIEEPAAAQPAAQAPVLPSLSFTDAVAAIWLLGIVALAVRATRAHLALRRVTSRATVVSESRVLAILQEAANAFRVRRRITLLSHGADGLPCTFGVVRPVILVPAPLVTTESPDHSRLRVVLTHETAHIARLDAISERITQVAVMLFWFNPIVWLAARQARFERERAADDAVLACGAKASDYASDLLAIAGAQSNTLWSSAVPMAASSLERRVRAILDDRIRRRSHSRMSLALALAVVAAMLPVSAVRLVARSAPLPFGVRIDIPQRAASPSAPVSSPAPIATQVPSRAQNVEQSDPLTVWNTERERNLRQVLRRARAAREEAMTKAAIGTTLPVDVTVLETTIAQIEEGVKNFTPVTAPMTAQELKRNRGAFQAMLSGLERAEFRFTNGLLTSGELANVLLRTAQVIEPSIQAPAPKAGRVDHTSPFAFRPEPTPADNSRARELYSLLTGQVSFVDGTQVKPADAQAAAKALEPKPPAAPSPADAMFTEANFPGSTQGDRNSAKALYALLTGRVQSASGTANLSVDEWNKFVAESKTQRGFVYITGDVQSPGKYALGDRMNVLQLLTLAGGLTKSTDQIRILVISGTLKGKDGLPLVRSVNFRDLMMGKNLKENLVELEPSDEVIVRSPSAGYYWQR